MSIDVLAADERGDENVQRWLASGLPVPPSWRISRHAVLEQDTDGLVRRLRALPRMFNGERYWVLHQGAMNAESQRESLLNLDSDEALAAALTTVFGRDPAPEQVVVQALPRQRAAGVLFTRHPLRQDLPHMVVEGVVEGGAERQRLIFDEDGRLVYRADSDATALDQAVPASQLLALGEQLKRGFERPQAGEWIHDGERLWLLQTLPVGSLPVPKEVWTRRATPALFNQALTPLWYTLAGRWLKTHFWRRLVERHGWSDLARIEPYRRQQSHLYTNSEFFRRLREHHPGAAAKVPPAWQPLESVAGLPGGGKPAGRLQHWRQSGELAVIGRRLKGWRAPHRGRERLWRSLMELDRIGERLAAQEGALAYLSLPDRLLGERDPIPLALLLSDVEMAALRAVLAGDQSALEVSRLRTGADPVHAPLCDKPAQFQSLRTPARPPALHEEIPPHLDQSLLRLARRARGLRFAVGNRLRTLLVDVAALLVRDKLLAHPDDVFFLYFDELWELWMQGRVPASASGDVIGQRKVRYLEDAHAGAPDWKMDRIGFGFGGGGRLSPVLRGATLVPGTANGPLRRLCSAWALNRLQPGDIVVVDQVDPSWAPWLVQAAGLVITGRDPANVAASLAVACSIPAVWDVSDVMHSVVDGRKATLDERGELIVNNE
ncbi:MAG: pyruvate, phosphate dikinase [Alcanivorax sp.]|nr:pyruvate, phosphate dikinase [Alcanivorax sp.]QVL41595.1 MAG: pyruvate, phosphate dikinase [Alcanivorax sp.]